MDSSQTAVLTGAAGGIGRAVALRLAEAGMSVLALDRDEAGLVALADEASKVGRRIETFAADVTDRTALQEAAARATANKRTLRFWINNAGIARNGDFLEMGPEPFDLTVAINLNAVVDGTRVALGIMEKAGVGKIVNVASVAGFIPAPFMVSYCATKHAVVGFTRALALELKMKQSPVRTLLVAPGFVETAIISKGEKLGYPTSLSFALSQPGPVAGVIVRAMMGDREEVYPTLNGRLMKAAYRLAPKLNELSSRFIMSRMGK